MSQNPPVLVLLGQPRPQIQIDELEPTESELTRQQIRRIEVEISVQGDDLNEQFLQELRPSKPGDDTLISDTAGGRWRVGNRRYRTHGDDRFTHTLELHEHEVLALARVEFGQLSLVPEDWKLSGGKPLVLTTMVALEPAENTELEQAIVDDAAVNEARYFPVRLVGVREDPTAMRFGRCYWQPLDDGRIRHVINLVAEEGDDGPSFLGFNEPDTARLKEHSITDGRKLDALIHELRIAGVLDEDATKRITDQADNPPDSAWREFDRARRIEDFMRD